MIWNICLAIAFGCILLFVLQLICRFFIKVRFSVVWWAMGLTAAGTFALIFPVHLTDFAGEAGAFWKAVFISLQNTMQVFSLDGDYDSFRAGIPELPQAAANAYLILGAVFHGIAPVITVGAIAAILSYFTGQIALALGLYSDLYVFSELNERSVLLAADCLKNSPVRVWPFKPKAVFASGRDESGEALPAGTEVPSICVRRDLLELPIRWWGGKRVHFFLMGADDNENIQLMLGLAEKYGKHENGSIYFFNSTAVGAALMASVMTDEMVMRVRRIDVPQSLVYSYLYREDVFAAPVSEEDGVRQIRAAVIGAGRIGIEFLKAMIWCGQMPGYHLTVHVFDLDPGVEERFAGACPELMARNGLVEDGEARYTICFHRRDGDHGFDVRTKAFQDELEKAGRFSRVFVALGDDDLNIETAIRLREIFLREGQPDVKITAVVAGSVKNEALGKYELKNCRKEPYGIEFIGDVRENYSWEVIMKSELERAGRENHEYWSRFAPEEEQWSKKREFDRYDYYYRSSVAKEIRRSIRVKMHVPAADKPLAGRTAEERRGIQLVEHVGWNAYMRTEGYSYSPVRSDLARLHPLLVPFDRLPEEEQTKDDV